MSSPTTRSLKKLRDAGYMAEVVERFNRFAGPHGIRQDLFNFIDIVAVKGNDTLGIQTTTQSGVSKRIAKICALQSADSWLHGSSRRILVHGWAKRGPRGKRKVWTCSETEITPDQIQPEAK